MEAFTLVFILFAIAVIGVVAFGIWAALSIVRLVFRGIFGFFDSTQPNTGQGPAVCDRTGCRALNAPGSKFCRRCGQELTQSRSSGMIMW